VRKFTLTPVESMKILFLHGLHSTPGGLKPTFLRNHGHTVLNPHLPEDDFDAAVAIAQAEYDQAKPDVVVGSSRGGAVAVDIESGDTPLVLLCPAWKTWGTATTVKANTTILHSRADETVPFADSEELVRNSGLPSSALIEVGTEHRLADEESLAAMLRAVEAAKQEFVLGSDVTSAPTPRKPITVAVCKRNEQSLLVMRIDRLVNFQSFALLLNSGGRWITGIDFPFGQPQRLIDDLDWPNIWEEYVRYVTQLGKTCFRQTINEYRKGRAKGDKEHHRATDRKAGSISPMKVYGTPVGMMFCEGAPFLLASPASVLPFLPDRDRNRIIVETYPKLVVKKILGRASYKTDDQRKVTETQKTNRATIVAAIRDASSAASIRTCYGFHIECSESIAQNCIDDPSGDTLDAVLCALQSAWAWSKRDHGPLCQDR
jgi:hypothetical protein